MSHCKDKIKLTPEEEKELNKAVFQILLNGLEIINKRFDKITYPDDNETNTIPKGTSKRNMTTEWIDIKGYENYYISNDGRIFSKSYKKTLKPAEIKGYPCVSLSNDFHSKSFLVHRLVAIHFIDNPGNKPQVNHKDGDRMNGHVSNLEWVTNKENSDHAKNVLLRKFGTEGEKSHKAKLTNEDVITIRKMKNYGVHRLILAEQYGVTTRTINHLTSKKGHKGWKHLTKQQ